MNGSPKHTPGPWVTGAGACDQIFSKSGVRKTLVATCADIDESDYRTRLANGQLIAAAPELLEACKALLGPAGPHAPRRTLAEAGAIRALALAAIEKAGGSVSIDPVSLTNEEVSRDR